ncbi:hypothetical protein BD324DRAFT_610525 [Kockovaella imperatae]|uniref:Methyltransferase domain-containing protein n=1 Tax=Kockovaella imperatae TaxID=4999 RepID=A0A1Y1U832_9TREE|nr:hypothetical protein BD324DRAFT_610525 [Kockovaella imperatae]ORX33676.1 hypothetical protein BD324DRAFT_610525 [Kockovaella imperatae]
MKLPYNRPHFFEFHDQPWCPPTVTAQAQAILTFLWTHRIPPFQSRAPYHGAADVLSGLIRELEGDKKAQEKGKGRLKVVDCCSGAGGPIPAIERVVNKQRVDSGLTPIPFVLSDLNPHLSSWAKATATSTSNALSFIPYPVDATHAPAELTRERHIRTFCLSFHHFNEDAARKIIQDAIKGADALCIFELQEPRLESLLELLAIFPLVFLVTPFTKPTISILILTYILPVLPFLMVFDGLVSAYRTRSLEHVRYLANLANLTLNLEGNDVSEWSWNEGRRRHTWPSGKMYWIIGKRESDGSSSW